MLISVGLLVVSMMTHSIFPTNASLEKRKNSSNRYIPSPRLKPFCTPKHRNEDTSMHDILDAENNIVVIERYNV